MSFSAGISNFTPHQQTLLNALSYLTVTRFTIQYEHGCFIIRKSGIIRTFLYYAIWVNSLVKISYLVMNYHGMFPNVEVHFLDQMSMWDWFLCFSQLVQETNLWYRKYPLFEALAANWRVIEEVYSNLGRPKEVEKKIMGQVRGLAIMHSIIVFVGCGALMFQFYATPKYALNTYAVLPFDNWILRLFFSAHEYIYIFHIWVHQASSIVLLEIFSINYTHILRQMAVVMRQLSEQGPIILAPEDPHAFKRFTVSRGQSSDSLKRRKRGSSRERLLGTDDDVTSSQFIPDRNLDPTTIAEGTKYNILGLLNDYKKIMMAAKEFNAWAGKWMGGTTGSNYGQFVSDVFMMIQLLKEPDTDIMGVFFFMEDACAGMCMLFRMLILISRVYPASEEFLETFKEYTQHQTPLRKYFKKYKRTMRIVATKIGGYSTKPGSVPKGINALMNFYISAAMWKRPDDPTRRN